MRILFPIVLAIIITSCDSTDQSFYFGDNLTLEVGSQIMVATKPGDDRKILDVSVVEISDSRCPADAICIWSGNVLVEFDVEGQVIILCLGECSQGEYGSEEMFEKDELTYKIVLLDVQPYPLASVEQGKKNVTFRIVKV